MLLPKEKPFLKGLNSYYLHLEKLIEHLQGEIGSGCVYGKSSSKEFVVFFDDNEIIRTSFQEKNEKKNFYTDLTIIKEIVLQNNFVIDVYYLSPNAIFFWGHMLSFQRAKSALKSTEIPLPDLIFRLKQKQFSGFIDVQLVNNSDSGLLFFNEGERIGGSYSWSNGGMTKADEDYNTLLSRVQRDEGVFKFGSYITKEKTNLKTILPTAKTDRPKVINPVSTPLRAALEELLYLYIQTVQEKGVPDPVKVLNEYIKSQLDTYPYLDPYMGHFEYAKGIVKLSKEAPAEKITKALVACLWAIVRAYNVEKSFRKRLSIMRNKNVFESKNILIEL